SVFIKTGRHVGGTVSKIRRFAPNTGLPEWRPFPPGQGWTTDSLPIRLLEKRAATAARPPFVASLRKKSILPRFALRVYCPIRTLLSDFNTSRHYLASVPPYTLPAPLRG